MSAVRAEAGRDAHLQNTNTIQKKEEKEGKKQLEAVANRMFYCFTGTNKVQLTWSLFIICSVRLQTWAQRANFMNGPR